MRLDGHRQSVVDHGLMQGARALDDAVFCSEPRRRHRHTADRRSRLRRFKQLLGNHVVVGYFPAANFGPYIVSPASDDDGELLAWKFGLR